MSKTKFVRFDGKTYDVKHFDGHIKELFIKLSSVDALCTEKEKLLAVLTRAHNSYMKELRNSLIAQKAGFDFTTE